MRRTVKPDGFGSGRGRAHGMLAVLVAAIFLGQIALAPRVHANTADLCDAAAVRAARATDVPLSVLRAITRTETGRNRAGTLQPWPWTVNMEGVGEWFETEEAARAYVQTHFDRGARSFDVGCFQINYRWHGKAFASIDEMFEPDANARYAARFLTQLFSETGDWSRAAGAYHSRTPKFAERYVERFDRIRARLTDQPQAIAAADAVSTSVRQTLRGVVRHNNYPLLQPGGGSAGFGSLVPLPGAARPALFGLISDTSES